MVVLLGLGTGLAHARPATTDPAAVARRVLAADRYQTSWPEPGTVPERSSRVVESARERPRSPRSARPSRPGAAAGGHAIGVFLWVLLGLGAVALVASGARPLIERWRSRTPRSRPAPTRTDDGEPQLAPDLAQALAAARRWPEAVHALLARALDLLADVTGRPTSPGATARELVRRLDLRDDPRRALSVLVVAVESSLFGGEPLTEADWERCREAYSRAVVGSEGDR
jgi:hypothetical protein